MQNGRDVRMRVIKYRISNFLISMMIIAHLPSMSCLAGINHLTLEEKVGQLLMVHFHGQEVNEDARLLINDLHVGGIIYYNWSNGLHSPRQIQQLSDGLQELAKQNKSALPLLIAIDQEGGVVSRLTQGFTLFSGNKALGMTEDPRLAEQCAEAMGKELLQIGVNLNLAPVADIHSNPKNPVIGLRSFGETAERVTSFSRAALTGYHKAGILTALKHFPGHGDVDVDSHVDLPVLNKSLDELKKVELLPYQELIDQTDTILTAHLMVPTLDPFFCSTLSKNTLDYLKNEMGFKGVIISDSLVMEGLLKNCASIDEAAIQAINAGCDLLLLGGKQLIDEKKNLELNVRDIHRIHVALVHAVQSGKISIKRLDEAVQKILNLKKSINLKVHPPLHDPVSTASHQALAKKIAALSIRKIVNKSLFGVEYNKILYIAPSRMKENLEVISLPCWRNENACYFFSALNPEKCEFDEVLKVSTEADLIIFFSYNAWKNKEQELLIQELMNLHKPFILIASRDPLDATLFPTADIILSTYSPTIPSLQMVKEHLKMEIAK